MSASRKATLTTRVRGLAPWQPQSATRELIETVRRVLTEYLRFLPMTLRQVFYRLVGAHGFDKTEVAYKRLGEIMNRARRAKLIPFSTIRDDDAGIFVRIGYSGPHELIESWQRSVKNFQLDRQAGQASRRLIMVEARGMVPQVQSVADRYGVPVIGSGGFDSLTAKYTLAHALGTSGELTEVLHIGDHDPSGVHLFTSMAQDVQALMRDSSFGGEARFTRLAVTPEQIDKFGLETAPPKESDRRSFDGNETVQCEAIPPDMLAQLVIEALDERFDEEALSRVRVREERLRKALGERLDLLLVGAGFDDADEGGAA